MTAPAGASAGIDAGAARKTARSAREAPPLAGKGPGGIAPPSRSANPICRKNGQESRGAPPIHPFAAAEEEA